VNRFNDAEPEDDERPEWRRMTRHQRLLLDPFGDAQFDFTASDGRSHPDAVTGLRDGGKSNKERVHNERS